MNLRKRIGSFNFKKFIKTSRTDFGVLKVAFMVAALDGEVTDAEFAAFEAMAKKCRGYTAASAAGVLDEAMRSAGYLMLLGRRATDAQLVKAFVKEARAALPDGFAYCSLEDVRRAIVTWIAMGMSDGDYSARERKCIEALRRTFAELKVAKAQRDEERALMLSPVMRQACCVHGVPASGNVQLVTRDFVGCVERLVRQMGDSAEAAKQLQALVANG